MVRVQPTLQRQSQISGPAVGTVGMERPAQPYQAWHRDANPTLTSNFTDAVAVTFQ